MKIPRYIIPKAVCNGLEDDALAHVATQMIAMNTSAIAIHTETIPVATGYHSYLTLVGRHYAMLLPTENQLKAVIADLVNKLAASRALSQKRQLLTTMVDKNNDITFAHLLVFAIARNPELIINDNIKLTIPASIAQVTDKFGLNLAHALAMGISSSTHKRLTSQLRSNGAATPVRFIKRIGALISDPYAWFTPTTTLPPALSLFSHISGVRHNVWTLVKINNKISDDKLNALIDHINKLAQHYSFPPYAANTWGVNTLASTDVRHLIKNNVVFPRYKYGQTNDGSIVISNHGAKYNESESTILVDGFIRSLDKSLANIYLESSTADDSLFDRLRAAYTIAKHRTLLADYIVLFNPRMFDIAGQKQNIIQAVLEKEDLLNEDEKDFILRVLRTAQHAELTASANGTDILLVPRLLNDYYATPDFSRLSPEYIANRALALHYLINQYQTTLELPMNVLTEAYNRLTSDQSDDTKIRKLTFMYTLLTNNDLPYAKLQRKPFLDFITNTILVDPDIAKLYPDPTKTHAAVAELANQRKLSLPVYELISLDAQPIDIVQKIMYLAVVERNYTDTSNTSYGKFDSAISRLVAEHGVVQTAHLLFDSTPLIAIRITTNLARTYYNAVVTGLSKLEALATAYVDPELALAFLHNTNIRAVYKTLTSNEITSTKIVFDYINSYYTNKKEVQL